MPITRSAPLSTISSGAVMLLEFEICRVGRSGTAAPFRGFLGYICVSIMSATGYGKDRFKHKACAGLSLTSNLPERLSDIDQN